MSNKVVIGFEAIQDIDQDGKPLGSPSLGVVIYDDYNSVHFGDYSVEEFKKMVAYNDQQKLNMIVKYDHNDDFVSTIVEQFGFMVRERGENNSYDHRWIHVLNLQTSQYSSPELAVVDDNGDVLYPHDLID